MDCAPRSTKQQKLLTDILVYVANCSGLRVAEHRGDNVEIRQLADGKSIRLTGEALDDVLFRTDTSGATFIQVNFLSGQKILLTDTLIGFKPDRPRGVDLARLPRVVTTPDVVNVFDAIQEALHSHSADAHEVAILKKVYEAVLVGGEAVGFDLSNERSWVARIPIFLTRVAS